MTAIAVSETARSGPKMANAAKIIGAFFVAGLLSGLGFAWLTSLRSLQEWWFIRSDKFLIGTHKYWILFGVTFLFGLMIGFAITTTHTSLRELTTNHTMRLALAALIIVAAAPALSFITPLMRSLAGLSWSLFGAPIAFVFLLSLALCLCIQNFRYLALVVGINLLVGMFAMAVTFVVLRIMNGLSSWYDFAQWAILQAFLVSSSGFWLVLAKKSH